VRLDFEVVRFVFAQLAQREHVTDGLMEASGLAPIYSRAPSQAFVDDSRITAGLRKEF
jgi:hypothetical protein